MLRVLIVDDERLARQALRRLLAEHPEVEIVGEAESVADALQAIDKPSRSSCSSISSSAAVTASTYWLRWSAHR